MTVGVHDALFCGGPLSRGGHGLSLSSGEPMLPLSFGQRVTFFAGAKKVTKETPFESELAQEELLGVRKGCAESHTQLGFRRLQCTLFGCSAAESCGCFRSVEAGLIGPRQKSPSEHISLGEAPGKPGLPLSFGQRVTFFAGAKKVTKETPFESEQAQEELLGVRKWCAESHMQLGLRTLSCAPLNFRSGESDECPPVFESGLISLRRNNCSEHLYRIFRLTPRRSWARSDSERCFFGDFLCTSKESYPLAAGQRKLLPSAGQRKPRPSAGHRKHWPSAGQRKLLPSAGQRKPRPSAGHRKHWPSAGQRKLRLSTARQRKLLPTAGQRTPPPRGAAS